jgi:hypothetical protein
VTSFLLPEDDAQARYFGLVTLALEEIGRMQDWNAFGNEVDSYERMIDADHAEQVKRELDARGFYYSQAEVVDKENDFMIPWLIYGGDADG